MIILIILI